MTVITDKERRPSDEEISEYVGNPLFDELCRRLDAEYAPTRELMYSGDSNLAGWNLRFCKSGRTLCRLYPKRGGFWALVVVGRREKERAEAALPQMSAATRALYDRTPEGMGQRWLMFELDAPDAVYEDMLALVALRAAPTPKK